MGKSLFEEHDFFSPFNEPYRGSQLRRLPRLPILPGSVCGLVARARISLSQNKPYQSDAQSPSSIELLTPQRMCLSLQGVHDKKKNSFFQHSYYYRSQLRIGSGPGHITWRLPDVTKSPEERVTSPGALIKSEVYLPHESHEHRQKLMLGLKE